MFPQVARSTMFKWISDRLKELGSEAALSIQRPAGRVEDFQEAALQNLPENDAIPFLQRLQDNLRRLDAVMGLAYRNGEVHNPKLVLDTVDAVGRTLARAARIQSVIENRERHEQFIAALVEVIMEEPAEVRDRIVSKMGLLRSRFGQE
jgi:hypothetical protein